jgi:hypothetical protein
VADAVPLQRKLYSVNQIAVATLLGSVAAGSLLLAQNFAALGRFGMRARTLGCGVLATIALVALNVSFPSVPGLGFGLNVASLALMRVLAQDMQGDEIAARLSEGGQLHSFWWALLLSLLFNLLLVLAVSLAAATVVLVLRTD